VYLKDYHDNETEIRNFPQQELGPNESKRNIRCLVLSPTDRKSLLSFVGAVLPSAVNGTRHLPDFIGGWVRVTW
jgi:hypothetical protein